MFNNYIKIAFRNLKRHSGYAVINILGLSIGLTTSFIAALFVFDEASYDTFHEDGHRIYRITKSYFNGDKVVETVPFRSYLLSRMEENISAIQSTTSIKPLAGRQIVYLNDTGYKEDRLAFADANFFDFFSFELLQGEKKNALKGLYSVVISEQKAFEYFSDIASPIGKVITIKDAFDGVGFNAKITGIFKDMPENSHFHYDFLISMSTGKAENDRRGIYSFPMKYGYLKLYPSRTIKEVSDLIPAIEKQYAPSFYADYDMHLNPQPLLDIHLKSQKQKEMELNGDIHQVYIFIGVAFLILLIACFNYINLATARAVKKIEEVKLRRAIGANRNQLILQFLVEAMLIAFLALLIAGLLTTVVLPFFNAFSGKLLVLKPDNYQVIAFFVLLTFLVGLFSGIYPARFLSGKNLEQTSTSTKPELLRKGLIVFQFIISSALIVITIVVFDQWKMLSNRQYSFESEEIINVPVTSIKIRESYKVLKEELLRNSNIKTVTGCNKDFISELNSFNGLIIPGHEGYVDMYYASIDSDFFGLYGKKMISGRNFFDYSRDSLDAIIINEAAAKLIGLTPDEALGLTIKVYDGYSPKVIGVVQDFQFQSLHGGLVPMYYQLFQSKEVADHLKVISLNINTNNVNATLAEIESVFKKFDEKALIDYTFLDYDIQLAYNAEQQFSVIFTSITTVAILIACMGVFGITTANTNRRRKELGVRKVLGASILNILLLINKDYLKLIIIANLVGFPIAYMITKYWLQNFTYQIDISASTFILATGFSLLMAILGASFCSVRAATSNPVDSLKTE